MTVILCADDYAMTEGVSMAIEQLAAAGRLSATSALVTGPHWASHAKRLAALRSEIAIGLHLNLTLGAPLGAMPALAPDGRLPDAGTIITKALTFQVALDEVAAEFTRQIKAFVNATGYEPDFIDGHQHVHAVGTIRRALVMALQAHSWIARPLIRDPCDNAAAHARRGLAVRKALTVGTLASGFGRVIRAAGFSTNHGFSGFSNFDTDQPYADELRRAFSHIGRRMLVMCHPGFPDAELAALDPVTERRRQEFDALLAADWLPARLWRPNRARPAGHLAGLWGSEPA